jgi:hypothetical protein
MTEAHINLAEVLERELLARHGPIIGGDDLRQALGFPTSEAFRQALLRGQVPVPVFSLEKRRGKFALVRDVGAWLARCRATAQPAYSQLAPSKPKEPP